MSQGQGMVSYIHNYIHNHSVGYAENLMYMMEGRAVNLQNNFIHRKIAYK